MMASLHFSWGRLPDDRVKLYEQMVSLLLVRWQEARLGPEASINRMVSSEKLEAALEQVAFEVHLAQKGAQGPADIDEATLLRVFKDYLEGSWDRAKLLVTDIQHRAGLLIDRGKGVYTFPHRSYQEYLAGCYLAVQPDFPDATAALARENYTQWRQVTLWAVGVMARLKRVTHLAVEVAAALCPHAIAGGAIAEIDCRLAHLAGEALLEIGLKDVQAVARHAPLLERVKEWLAGLVGTGALVAVERSDVANTLARFGDFRLGVGLGADGLPDIAWCEVPAGPFTMGDDKGYEFDIPYAYKISRYPVTNGQFQAFVDADGYRIEEYWREAKREGVWKNGMIQSRMHPEDYGEPFSLSNHPVVGITWYEALAFTRWLTEELRRAKRLGDAWEVRLPSEAEWEKAARGTDGRTYPWGQELDRDRANYDDTGIGSTSAVGCFPKGASPYGVEDMSGNVWEWTRSLWGKDWETPEFKYPYDARDGRENLDASREVRRVLRGGAFGINADFVRCAARGGNLPDLRLRNIGFRVVASPPSTSEL